MGVNSEKSIELSESDKPKKLDGGEQIERCKWTQNRKIIDLNALQIGFYRFKSNNFL